MHTGWVSRGCTLWAAEVIANTNDRPLLPLCCHHRLLSPEIDTALESSLSDTITRITRAGVRELVATRATDVDCIRKLLGIEAQFAWMNVLGTKKMSKCDLSYTGSSGKGFGPSRARGYYFS